MAGKKKTFQLEEAFKELEDIIKQLESDTLPLRDSIELYGKGAKLVAACKEELTGIEKEMIVTGQDLSGEEEGEEE